MKDLFDAQELRRYDMPDGSLMHAELMLDDTVIMLGQATESIRRCPWSCMYTCRMSMRRTTRPSN
ncbi:MAG: hypothetical protein R2811_00110 [Flavobacteriales bacterium]